MVANTKNEINTNLNDNLNDLFPQTEDEIQTLRQVLAARVKHAQDLKRRLGVTVWREFSDDLSSQIKNVKESQT